MSALVALELIELAIGVITKGGISIAEFKASINENGKIDPEQRDAMIQRAQEAIDKL